jgi:hypothetical protein
MMASRSAVLRGETIELTASFLDAAKQPADPTNIVFSIYPPENNPESGATVGDAWVYNVTLTSGGSGPQADSEKKVEKIETGKYKYSFSVPEDADLGPAFDRWEATLDLEDLDETFTFVIVGGGSVGTTKLYNNNIVITKLNMSVASTDGATLAEDTYFSFTTTYEPLYSSIRRIRLDLGALIADVPNDTIYLAIFEASLYVDEISFTSTITNGTYFAYAKRQLTTCLAERILVGALLGDSSISSRLAKSLDGLSVSRGGLSKELGSSASKLDDCIANWTAVVESGGEMSPHTSLKPEFSVKGALADDAIAVSRQWEPTSSVGGYMPSANTRVDRKNSSSRRGYRTHRDRY